ncbi:hypothetical protein KHA76_001804 [Salmonella enterica subsp. houtenae serovar 44:z36,[z38]:-]|uniref:Uncharacterized protein n=1 Tax=Salmonella enterica subsp. houtenae serovar 44:z36[z38]:- TaxID=1967609 RepID=A0A736MF29_SALHO|nr:hypothetical protein [Salmonella enterica]EHM8757113.1 hypothetical protein [Salmonella enterica subsp. houtenae serovar 44:z36,[z38]:-]HAE7580906.1 hypothetical protein [Salmonella enterica subsp. houtenae serovar 44:z36[z38]:-]HCM6266700.1 hypothetical protein [Salmonella enterica subsp. houtenae serovar 44:z36,Z38:-]EGF3877527.1 hypothetical protein [Salmonella enterica]
MINTFISRPTWTPPEIEKELTKFYQLIDDMGFQSHTIGKEHSPLRSPFEDVHALMKKCGCTIVLGLPQIFICEGEIKHVPLTNSLILPTEWNQIEATMSLMLDLPTLMLQHSTITSRGIFERGAANVFVHEFDTSKADWVNKIRPQLNSLKQACKIL